MMIRMPRGDLRVVRFQINKIDGNPVYSDFEEIYFTVKRLAKDRDYLFQKRLSTGGIEKLGFGDYQVKIMPEDTENLQVNTIKFPNYVFDIQLVCNGGQGLKQTFVGRLVLTEEVTYPENE